MGRRLWMERDCDAASAHFNVALAGALPSVPLTLEANRIAGICATRRGKLDRAEQIFTDLRDDKRAPTGLQVEASEWLARLKWLRDHHDGVD
jgi:Tfp pilus assembly protein PilF